MMLSRPLRIIYGLIVFAAVQFAGLGLVMMANQLPVAPLTYIIYLVYLFQLVVCIMLVVEYISTGKLEGFR